MEKNWEKCFTKGKKHDKKYKKNFLKYKNLNSFKVSIITVKNEYLKDLKPLATRKSSELFLNVYSKNAKHNWWFI